MNKKLEGIFLLVCAVVVGLIGFSLFSEVNPIEVNMPVFTKQMAEELQAKNASAEQKRQYAQAVRNRADLEIKIYGCQTDDDCIIVDKDPCGCLRGPEGVTAINAEWSLEFSKLVEKQFSSGSSCPSAGSAERECSDTAAAVCQENHCKIVW